MLLDSVLIFWCPWTVMSNSVVLCAHDIYCTATQCKQRDPSSVFLPEFLFFFCFWVLEILPHSVQRSKDRGCSYLQTVKPSEANWCCEIGGLYILNLIDWLIGTGQKEQKRYFCNKATIEWVTLFFHQNTMQVFFFWNEPRVISVEQWWMEQPEAYFFLFLCFILMFHHVHFQQ